MTWKVGRRVAAMAVAGMMVVALAALGANAGSSLDVAVATRHELASKILQLHDVRRAQLSSIKLRIAHAEARLQTLAAGRTASATTRFDSTRERQRRSLHRLLIQQRALIREVRSRVEALRLRRAELLTWIESLPLETCPVAGTVEVVDGFGDIRDMPGTPHHIHQGNDISASTGTPIVAPFDGDAVMEPGDLGGQAVKVYGAAGYVYNAHLSAYGKLGAVRTGDVIGYVGSTGNATAPHDHFEWHPGNGAAVDPYDALMAVC